MATIEGKDLVDLVEKLGQGARINDLRDDMNKRFNIVFWVLGVMIAVMAGGFFFLLERLP